MPIGPYYTPGKPLASDIIHQKAMEKLKGLLVPAVEPVEGPNIWPQRPEQFRNQLPAVPKAPSGDLSELVPRPANLQDVTSAYNPAKQVTGSIEYSGPQLNTERALSGLREAQGQFGGGFRRPTEELYKQSFAAPETVAPGAREMARAELEPRVGAEEFARLLGQKQQETIQTAQTGLHPAVQAQQEAAAQRATYPARAAGQASTLAGMFGLQREQARGQAAVEAARARRDAQAGQAVTRAMSELAVGPQDESDEDRALRMNLMQRLDAMEKALRSGEYFLSDYADIDPIAAGIMENYIDEIEGATSSGF